MAEEKTYRVVLSIADEEVVAELQSTSHWCEQCVVFVTAMRRKIESYTTYDGDVGKLKVSSADGCLMCGMILDRCDPDQTKFWIELRSKADSNFYMDVRGSSPYGRRHLAFKRQHFGQAPPNPDNLPANEGTSSTWHKMLARKWLSCCQRSHRRCNDRMLSTFFPTRLLRLSCDNNEVFLKLCDTKAWVNIPTAGSSSSYCTLSHRWSDTQPLKLTRASYQSFRENIPFEVLPKTFADAVHITLNLGVSYLWIDSLCICQDDRDDWLAESARMGDIYANGICNIGALDPGACFFEGPTPASDALYFSVHGKRYITANYNYPTPYDDRLNSTSLGKRGWVFQELVLSPRTVFYGANGISWDCIEATADEVNSMRGRLPYTRAATAQKSTFAHLQSTATGSLSYPHIFPCDDLWSNVISEYTRTELSFETDKWLAISGLARIYVEGTGHRLTAGLRCDQLLEQLAWWSKDTRGRILNGAPTWSWLSCRSWVGIYTAKSEQMLATIVLLPDEQVATQTWHIMYSPIQFGSTTTQAKKYPMTISGHVRPFCYTAQEGRFNESLDASFQKYSIEVQTDRIWMDVPLANNTLIWGVPHSWTLPFDPRFSMMFFVVASHDHGCWQRVGVCSALAHGFGKWDNPTDREGFLLAFGPEKDMTVI